VRARFNWVTVEVVHDDIVNETADAIVNCTSDDMDLIGTAVVARFSMIAQSAFANSTEFMQLLKLTVSSFIHLVMLLLSADHRRTFSCYYVQDIFIP